MLTQFLVAAFGPSWELLALFLLLPKAIECVQPTCTTRYA